MAKRTYEDQAKLSVILAIVGGLAAAGVIWLLWRNFDARTFYVHYSGGGKWLLALLAALGVGLASSAVGLLVAFNSAGQRRNAKSALSWKGFFANALAITIMLAAGVFFYFTRNAVR